MRINEGGAETAVPAQLLLVGGEALAVRGQLKRRARSRVMTPPPPTPGSGQKAAHRLPARARIRVRQPGALLSASLESDVSAVSY